MLHIETRSWELMSWKAALSLCDEILRLSCGIFTKIDRKQLNKLDYGQPMVTQSGDRGDPRTAIYQNAWIVRAATVKPRKARLCNLINIIGQDIIKRLGCVLPVLPPYCCQQRK